MTKIGNCYAGFSKVYKNFIFKTDIFKLNNYTTTLFVFLLITQHCGIRMQNCRFCQLKCNLISKDCNRSRYFVDIYCNFDVKRDNPTTDLSPLQGLSFLSAVFDVFLSVRCGFVLRQLL